MTELVLPDFNAVSAATKDDTANTNIEPQKSHDPLGLILEKNVTETKDKLEATAKEAAEVIHKLPTQLKKIETILRNKGMDSQQVVQAMQQIVQVMQQVEVILSE